MHTFPNLFSVYDRSKQLICESQSFHLDVLFIPSAYISICLQFKMVREVCNEGACSHLSYYISFCKSRTIINYNNTFHVSQPLWLSSLVFKRHFCHLSGKISLFSATLFSRSRLMLAELLLPFLRRLWRCTVPPAPLNRETFTCPCISS